MKSIQKYDICIVGGGIAGSMVAAILAKKGISVVIVDAATHPRFAVGESMVPESAIMVNLIAKRFGMPELAYVAHPRTVVNNITTTCGVKLNFGFAYNKAHQEQNPEQIVAPALLTPEPHLFRQDIDAYYFNLAVKNGATAKQFFRIKNIEINDDGILLDSEGSESIFAKYVVDASGFRSPFADKFGMRATPNPMQTHSRSLFTHMVNVEPFEKVVHSQEKHGSPTYLSQGTLHHFFEGGWLWIIPFDNNPISKSNLCSVGLQLDTRLYGPPQDPETEFAEFLKKYPSVAKQFTDARRVREWTVAPRLSYTSKKILGPRFCLLAHAAGFVDPLFSRGLVITFDAINNLVPKLIEAVKENDFSEERFEFLERSTLNFVRTNDRLVANSFTAFQDFDLFNAWHRIWISGVWLGGLRLRTIIRNYSESADESRLTAELEGIKYPGALSRDSDQFEALFDKAASCVEKVQRKELAPAEATKMIYALLAEYEPYLPPFSVTDPNHRFALWPTPAYADKIRDWCMNGPEIIREKFSAMSGGEDVDFSNDLRFGKLAA